MHISTGNAFSFFYDNKIALKGGKLAQ